MGGWIDGAGLWEWQQRSMCVSGQQLGKVYSSLPLGFLPPRLPLWEKSEPNRYSRGRRGGFGKRRVRKQKAEGWLSAPCLVPGSGLESPRGAEGSFRKCIFIIRRLHLQVFFKMFSELIG